MNDLKMGFKHTMLQRLHGYEVSPARTSPTGSPTAGQQSPQQLHVTDFSISRILSENKEKPLKSTGSAIRVQQAADILDLSKSSATTPPSPVAPYAYHAPTSYHMFHADFLAAAAAANATKFYAQFFPHIFPPYAAAANLPYQKRYFAPYIVNSAANFPTTRLTSSTTQSAEQLRLKSSCARADCIDCTDYYKQLPYKSAPLASGAPSKLSSSASGNYLKTKSSPELCLDASTISLTAVTNLNLTAKSAKLSSIVNSITSTAAMNAQSEEISYKCRICDKVFGCSQTLQAHEKTHKSPRYECNDCGKGFSQLRNYKYHLSVHRGTKEFAAECPECGKTFNDKGYLSSHMKIHRNKKEYECPYCPKSFNQRVAFNMHVRIHTGVKPHKCVECGKRFSRKMLLKQHMRTHSGEKPYQCSVCGKSFADRSNMTLHHRLHSGIKPFNCPICPKAFTKKHHLKTHLNYHTGCKPYVCPHPNCNQAFTQSSNMRTHAKKCQYRPLQLSFPVASSAAALASTTPSAASNTLATTTSIAVQSRLPVSAAISGAATHIPSLSNTLSAGIRMLSAASSPSAVMASAQTMPFPPAQQPLLSTLRPF